MGGNKDIPTKRNCNAILQFHGIGAYDAFFTVVYAPLRPHRLPVATSASASAARLPG
jgi:hypothetical protein